MVRRAKQSRLYLNNQISRSLALVQLAQNEINHCTIPAEEVEDHEPEDVSREQDKGGLAKCFVPPSKEAWNALSFGT